MADAQRIHPVHDVEAPPPPSAQSPEVPLVPRGAAKSDLGDHGDRYPAPPRRTIPVTHSKPPKKRRSCIRKCLCWTFSLIFIIIVLIAITVGILFLVFRPKLPKYSVDGLQVTQFNLGTDESLSASFDVNITARNPNKKIGIYYEGGSHISVLYTGTKLCEGALPKFYQGHRNTTELIVAMTGQTQNATSLLTSLQQEQQTIGHVPLKLRVNQPVRIKLGKLKLPKLKFRVRCNLEVNNISANDQISIQKSSCKFRLRL